MMMMMMMTSVQSNLAGDRIAFFLSSLAAAKASFNTERLAHQKRSLLLLSRRRLVYLVRQLEFRKERDVTRPFDGTEE